MSLPSSVQGECKHTSAKSNRQERVQQLPTLFAALKLKDYLTPLMAGETRIETWNAIATHLLSNPKVVTDEEAPLAFVELSVDAFLAHDYSNSVAFYFVHLLAAATHNSPSLDHFLQSILMYVPEDDPDVHKISTPWGTPYRGWPRHITPAQATRPFEVMLESLVQVCRGEDELLYALLRHPLVKCECLRYEDPYDPLFGTRTPEEVAKIQFSKKPHAYLEDCAKCRAMPATQRRFSSCAKCRRRRYCCKECQVADWAEHKAVCGKKRADWWGRAPRMSKLQRRQQGLM